MPSKNLGAEVHHMHAMCVNSPLFLSSWSHGGHGGKAYSVLLSDIMFLEVQ